MLNKFLKNEKRLFKFLNNVYNKKNYLKIEIQNYYACDDIYFFNFILTEILDENIETKKHFYFSEGYTY